MEIAGVRFRREVVQFAGVPSVSSAAVEGSYSQGASPSPTRENIFVGKVKRFPIYFDV